jgi:F-type H+-transporting ATPase subunit b
MKKLLLILLPFLWIGSESLAARTTTLPPTERIEGSEAAHGAETQAHRIVHPGEDHGTPTHIDKTYFGIPEWILKVLNLVLFLGLLTWLLGKPIRKVFADRKDTIRAQLSEAEVRQQKSDQLAADIQARLTAIEEEVEQILQRARQEGERQKQELIAAAETEAEKILAQARNEVDNRIKTARIELTEHARALAVERAQQIVAAEVTDDDRQRLFRESVGQIAGVRS